MLKIVRDNEGVVMKIKICGATILDEIALLNRYAVDYVGLWTGINGHPRSLTEMTLRILAAACDGPQPIAVCVQPANPGLMEMLHDCNIQWLQLHGFTPPSEVLCLKQQGINVIKTLHVDDNGVCPELRWLKDYDDAGVDIYLIDRFVSRQRIGSTGQALPQRVIKKMVERLQGRRVWLAGGIGITTIADFAAMPGVEALDIDSAARHEGRIGVPLLPLLQALHDGVNHHG
ncbi:phosphoribosylanthranilate isomerase [Jejubacter calystegiae]|nr:hypothetical protein [Jejubacter calystegiae]